MFHVVFGYVFHVCDCVIVCYTLRGRHIHCMMYMRNVISWLLHGKLDIHGIIEKKKKKKWNVKVRNYNLKGSEKEMNMKVLNFIEINKRSGWQVAQLR